VVVSTALVWVSPVAAVVVSAGSVLPPQEIITDAHISIARIRDSAFFIVTPFWFTENETRYKSIIALRGRNVNEKISFFVIICDK
jgi:hypothetical protein